ncbi:MAG: TetR/AcrR family transcriptional regulator [Campylobacterales bacterium]|nr:TetR/AcrR family transcriptional regulator [Campylobacterales bacterium]
MGEKTTKQKILDTALKLFAQDGYKATTVREIAKAIGIEQSALYNHFKSKDEILESIINELASLLIANIFKEINDDPHAYKQGKSLLHSISNKFKLISFDNQNDSLFRLMMQEIFSNSKIRDIYNEALFQENVKKLSGLLFMMMQEDMIHSSDPLMLAHEFFAPLFFYQMQVSLLKIDKKSTSSIISLFEKHVDFFWENIKIEKKESLF